MSCPSGNWYNLCVTQGYSFSSSLTAKDNNGIPVNLSGYYVTGIIEPRYTGPTLNTFTVSITSPPTSGSISFSLTPAQTLALPPTQCLYSLWAVHSGDSSPIELLKGYLNVFSF